MRVFEGKWLNREVELHREVESHLRTMSVLVGRAAPKHLADEAVLRTVLTSAAHIVYGHYRELLKSKRPGEEADIETKCRYNLSVTAIKRHHEKVLAEIQRRFDGWKASARAT